MVSLAGDAIFGHPRLLPDHDDRPTGRCGGQTRRGVCLAYAIGVCGHALQPWIRVPPRVASISSCWGAAARAQVADIPCRAGKIVLLARREATREEEAAPRQVSAFPATKLVPGHLPTPAITSPELPKVSVIVPCRNEVRWIAECLESIAHNDYPKDRLEVFIVDGMSDDGTRPIVRELCGRASLAAHAGQSQADYPGRAEHRHRRGAGRGDRPHGRPQRLSGQLHLLPWCIG